MSPYIQNAMAQAMQAIMAGGPLPPNCFIVTLPMQQVPQMLPQLMMNYAPSGGAMMFSPQPSYYGQVYPPQLGPYQNNQPSNALVPYSNYYPPGYEQNYNYPVAPYHDSDHKSKKKHGHGKKNRSEPHSNVYNSSSFDSDMRDLSWSRLFSTHHHHHSKKQDQAALSYDKKTKQQNQSSDSLTSTSTSSSSSSTTSDETIRRVNVSTKQPSAPSSLSSKQQTKGSLPFKYSSEFIPGIGKQQQAQRSNKKEAKFKSDDIFVVKKPQPSSSQQ
jgi:hypothetical protein